MSMRPAVPTLVLILSALAIARFAAPSAAHESARDEIRALDLRIGAGRAPAQDLVRRGELHRLERDWDAAEADYASAERLDAHLPELPLCRAALELDRGRPDAAIARLDPLLG